MIFKSSLPVIILRTIDVVKVIRRVKMTYLWSFIGIIICPTRVMIASYDTARRSGHNSYWTQRLSPVKSCVRMLTGSTTSCEKPTVEATKEAAVTTKDSNERYITQLRNMSEGSAATMKALHTREEELREALGLAHAEESKLCLLGVALRQKVATLTREKEENLPTWSREKKELTSSRKGGVGSCQGGARTIRSLIDGVFNID